MKQKLALVICILLIFGGLFALENNRVSPKQPVDTKPTVMANNPTSNVRNDTAGTPSKPDVTNSISSESLVSKTIDLYQAREVKLNGQIIASDGKSYPVRIYKPTLAPNDPGANQWWVGNTGLGTAWDFGAGNKSTIVAIIDTGFALNHEELTNRWHINSGESGLTASEAPNKLNCSDRALALNQSCNLIDDNYDGVVDNENGATFVQNPSKLNCSAQNKSINKTCNNIDDDNNGLIDDSSGWDFANFDSSVQAGEINPSGDGTRHATMVSGVLAATGNNGKGIAGVNWTTKILPMQALDDDGYGDTLTVSRAIRYAADQKADVISISLGTPYEDSYLRQAISYAINKGSVVVASSGNDGCECIAYPARFPEVIAVGASTPDGTWAGFSSYGTELDILAPGISINTTSWSSNNPTSTYTSGVAGTSFSAPYVSGMLALSKSHQPSASWGELTAALLSESDHKTLDSSNPRANNMGFGFVRADKALARLIAPARPTIRYNLGPITSTDTLDSTRIFQCQSSDYPTTMLYELKKNGQVRFSSSLFNLLNSTIAGWTVRNLGYKCTGLPLDEPQSTRHINLLTEINSSIDLKRN